MRGAAVVRRLLRARLRRRCPAAFLLLGAVCWAGGGALFLFFLAHGGVFSGRCTDEQSRRILARLAAVKLGYFGDTEYFPLPPELCQNAKIIQRCLTSLWEQQLPFLLRPMS